MKRFTLLDHKPDMDEFVVFDWESSTEAGNVVTDALESAEHYLGKGVMIRSVNVKAVHTDRECGEFLVSIQSENGNLSFVFATDVSDVLVWRD